MSSKISNQDLYDEFLRYQSTDLNSSTGTPTMKVMDYARRYSSLPDSGGLHLMKNQSIQYVLYFAYFMSKVNEEFRHDGGLSFPERPLTIIEESLLFKSFKHIEVIVGHGISQLALKDQQSSFVSAFFEAAQAGWTDPLITYLTDKIHGAVARGEEPPAYPAETSSTVSIKYQFYAYKPAITLESDRHSNIVSIEREQLIYLPVYLKLEDLTILSSYFDKSASFHAYVREAIGMVDPPMIDELYLYWQRD